MCSISDCGCWTATNGSLFGFHGGEHVRLARLTDVTSCYTGRTRATRAGTRAGARASAASWKLISNKA